MRKGITLENCIHHITSQDFEDLEFIDTLNPDDVRAIFAYYNLMISPDDAWGAITVSMLLSNVLGNHRIITVQ